MPIDHRIESRINRDYVSKIEGFKLSLAYDMVIDLTGRTGEAFTKTFDRKLLEIKRTISEFRRGNAYTCEDKKNYVASLSVHRRNIAPNGARTKQDCMDDDGV